VSKVDFKELKELTKTLDYLRRYLEHEQIMAVSKLYAWWAVAGLLGGGISLAISYAPISPQEIGLLQVGLWLTIAILITRAFAENVSRIKELSKALPPEHADLMARSGWEFALAWLLAFVAGVALSVIAGRLVSPSYSARIAVGLCSALGLGNLSNWALSSRMKRRVDGEPAVVGIANLASIPLLLSIEGDLTRFVAMLLVISLSYAWASLSYALKARRVLLGES